VSDKVLEEWLAAHPDTWARDDDRDFGTGEVLPDQYDLSKTELLDLAAAIRADHIPITGISEQAPLIDRLDTALRQTYQLGGEHTLQRGVLRSWIVIGDWIGDDGENYTTMNMSEDCQLFQALGLCEIARLELDEQIRWRLRARDE